MLVVHPTADLTRRRSPLRRQLNAAFRLRAVDRLGVRARVTGRPFIVNQGKIRIGRDFHLVAQPATSHLVAMGGLLEIGDRVQIACGASITALQRIRIGDDTQIGPYAVIIDSDFHVVGNRSAHATPQPIWIGRNVTIGHRVTILRGATIGNGVRVESGSVVSGNVPDGAVVAGVPAAPVMALRGSATGEDLRLDVAEVVQRVFGLPVPPLSSDGPDTIPAWDSLGALKLLLAIEQAFDITLGDADLVGAHSVEALAEIVRRGARTT
jgi:acetyltransferase-like isoleucine patch superfamily enzyme/acyl carrier protein